MTAKDPNARIKYYRKYKKMVSTFEIMKQTGFISDNQHKEWLRIADAIYSEWKRQLREARKPFLKQPGRPRTVIDRAVYTVCRTTGCGKPTATGQVYCSREHAPLANYGRGYRSREKE